MSEINELIARNAKMAYETGVSTVVTRDYYAVVLRAKQEERERIVSLLRARVTKNHPVLTMDIDDLGALIKGEQK